MKKSIIKKLSILASIIAISNGVNANEIKPYIGIGYQMSNVNYNTINGLDYNNILEDGFSNFNLFSGIKLVDKNLSLELSYFKSKDKNKNDNSYLIDLNGDTVADANSTKSKTSLEIISLDAIYHQKINNDFNFLFLGGLSKISVDGEVDYYNSGSYVLSNSDDQSGYGLNLGLGLEANIYNNISLRGVIKYTTVNSIDYFDDLVNYNLGVKYQF
jgi:opacity protein-like surface antigen